MQKGKCEYVRQCPRCKKHIFYINKRAFQRALKNNLLCLSCTKYVTKPQTALYLNRLLENTYESLYWIGFILADGHIADNRLVISLSIKDIEHLQKFKDFIGYTKEIVKYNNMCRISIKDIDIFEKLCIKFDITHNKTYNPPNINIFDSLTIHEQYCLIAGFIDGDGSIKKLKNRNDFHIAIKCHSTWYKFLEKISLIITNKNFAKINNTGYAQLVISNTEQIKDFKKQLLTYNIPLLKRKWDNINLNYISQYVIAKQLRNVIIPLIKQGMKYKDISKKYNVSMGHISQIKKKYILENKL